MRLPKVEAQVVLPLSHEDVVALHEAAAPWFRVVIVIGAGLGLRQSEAAGLTMDRVDFLRRTVRVDRQWQQATGTRPGAFAPTKTTAGKRIIPVGEWVLDELNLHLQQFGGGDGGVIVHTDGGRSTPPAGGTTCGRHESTPACPTGCRSTTSATSSPPP